MRQEGQPGRTSNRSSRTRTETRTSRGWETATRPRRGGDLTPISFEASESRREIMKPLSSRVRPSIALALAGLLIVLATGTVASHGGDTTRIHACVNTNGSEAGLIRIVTADAVCRANETALDWNIEGRMGPAGARGEQGVPGLQGEQGPMGPIGLPGADGATGATGEQGPMGPMGPQGADGATGATGAQGEPGADGPQGPQGEQGSQGIQGQIGPMGPQGEIGPMGPMGPQGADGATGATGAQGEPGADGAQGPQGDQGLQGIQGEIGPMGLQGEAGPMGLQGEQGLPGDPGADGAQGLQGQIGPIGPQGATGAQGAQGDRGPQGVQGPQGEPGSAHVTGRVVSAIWDYSPNTSGYLVTCDVHNAERVLGGGAEGVVFDPATGRYFDSQQLALTSSAPFPNAEGWRASVRAIDATIQPNTKVRLWAICAPIQ